MSSDWLSELLDRIGSPIPCALCGTELPAGELHEKSVPAGVVRFDPADVSFVLHETVWVCSACEH